jgi:hypothetical protein
MQVNYYILIKVFLGRTTLKKTKKKMQYKSNLILKDEEN